MNKNSLLGAFGLLASVFSANSHADHPSVVFGASTAGPVSTVTAATLPRQGVALGLQTEYIAFRAFSDDQLVAYASRHIHAHSTDSLLNTSLLFAYGVTDDLTLGVRLPYVQRRGIRAGHHHHDAEGVSNEAELHGDAEGLGDLILLGKYRAWFQPATQWSGALLFGLKLPTGVTRRTNR